MFMSDIALEYPFYYPDEYSLYYITLMAVLSSRY